MFLYMSLVLMDTTSVAIHQKMVLPKKNYDSVFSFIKAIGDNNEDIFVNEYLADYIDSKYLKNLLQKWEITVLDKQESDNFFNAIKEK